MSQATLHRLKVLGLGMVAVLACLVMTGSAAGELTGRFAKFAQCPFADAKVEKCVFAVTESGEVILGKKKVPIVHPVTLQGGFTAPNKARFSKFVAATNGVTLSKTAQPVPGGLLGIVPPGGSSPLVKTALAFFFENGLTRVNATLELARPASEISVGEIHLAEEQGVVLTLPLKIHLENPFLGGSCYVGSSDSPVVWELTSGATNPPAPNKPIRGSVGKGEIYEEGRIFALEGSKLVDNAWSAPRATGCGGFLSFLIDPIIDSAVGLPAKAGINTAVLVNKIDLASAFGLNENDEENP